MSCAASSGTARVTRRDTFSGTTQRSAVTQLPLSRLATRIWTFSRPSLFTTPQFLACTRTLPLAHKTN